MNLRHHSFSSSNHRGGFTILELLVATMAAVIVTAGVYTLMQAGLIVSVKGLSTNATGTAARFSLDRVNQFTEIAYDAPKLVSHTGATVTGTGPAAGVRFYRYGGGPYVINLPSAGLSGTTRSISLTCAKNAHVPPPVPQPYDSFVINTTILMSGSANQVNAYVAAGSATVISSTNGNKITYTIQLSEPLTGAGGSAGVIPADAGTVTAILIRPTAIVAVPTARGRELRLYETFPKENSLNVNTPHTVLTDQVALATWDANASASDAMSDANAKPFSLSTLNGRTFVNTDLRVRDNRYGKYLQTRQADEFASYLQINSRVPIKCNPNE